MERGDPLHFWLAGGSTSMPNFRDWTAGEIVVQMPEARNILAKHFGPDGVKAGSGARLRDIAKWKGVELEPVIKDLNMAAKGTGIFG